MVHYITVGYFLETFLVCFVFCNDLSDETLATEFNISTLKFVHAVCFLLYSLLQTNPFLKSTLL